MRLKEQEAADLDDLIDKRASMPKISTIQGPMQRIHHPACESQSTPVPRRRKSQHRGEIKTRFQDARDRFADEKCQAHGRTADQSVLSSYTKNPSSACDPWKIAQRKQMPLGLTFDEPRR